jgi:hypothetical protein
MQHFRNCGFAFGAVIAIAIGTLLLASCKPTEPWAQAHDSAAAQSQTRGPAHDLSFDESRGGHTLKRHVGRSDLELRQRLADEPNISAASTYTDRETAESVIAQTLDRDQNRIARWLQRDRHPNLVLDYDGDQPIGRTLNRGETQSQPCSRSIIVLHWDGPNGYHVLTSYPECR